ncbi:class I SAM-dependent methyltransferase [Rhizobium rhizogenes]|uniref:Methyltransferase type 11 domain-containing protein n=1 Tax=Rhizobium rhizogenes NBRC 13257 TaxID=1220581 RepID=A0AA87QF45_RHIRH|nr:methyltransferase domain-containing protein [Rhizobium rhizogenes]NTG68863.1 class I SAM-dependent methyltransferase [Rhizobium rhizogenes]NTH53042.1 class I SAM-dependent methyltransferase [Rhizobium rhizogenes]NTH72626.1 class I SAM-dependent methyltransferase [Rhizobium rhizogenes]NTI69671.1 class I SAM-dependent methyltransferase [Rhizobium rhizogenes]TRB04566.1 class I SAM-dependent methyltransferase [Rhizobium rhizogenes]
MHAAQKESVYFSYRGYCPICEAEAVFTSKNEWFRDNLKCETCEGGSRPRARALALILTEMRPNWRDLAIHESSPAPEGISLKLKREASAYVASQYYPDHPFGSTIDGFQNEDLERQTFADHVFDVVVTLDVMEHVYRPDLVFSEVFRTLKPGGLYLCTFPVRKYQVDGWERRFTKSDDGETIHHKEPEIHGNPIDGSGSIVTVDYGYDIHQQIARWAPFDVRVHRFSDRLHGIIGEYTEVFACKKPL